MPEEVDWVADEKTAEELFDRIMSTGNFSSKKDKEPLADKPVQGTVQNFKREGFLNYLQQAGIKNWKAARRFRMLRPFAWIYQLFRFLVKGIIRAVTGKSLFREI